MAGPNGGAESIIAQRENPPKTVDFKALPQHEKDACEKLMKITTELKVSWGGMEGGYYKQNRESIMTAVSIYDNLRKFGMPLYGLKKKDLFVSVSNPHAIIRVSDRTWGRFEKMTHCKEVWAFIEQGKTYTTNVF